MSELSSIFGDLRLARFEHTRVFPLSKDKINKDRLTQIKLPDIKQFKNEEIQKQIKDIELALKVVKDNSEAYDNEYKNLSDSFTADNQKSK